MRHKVLVLQEQSLQQIHQFYHFCATPSEDGVQGLRKILTRTNFRKVSKSLMKHFEPLESITTNQAATHAA